MEILLGLISKNECLVFAVISYVRASLWKESACLPSCEWKAWRWVTRVFVNSVIESKDQSISCVQQFVVSTLLSSTYLTLTVVSCLTTTSSWFVELSHRWLLILYFNPLKPKSRQLYLKTQFVLRCKHFHLCYKNQSVYAVSGTSRCLFSDKYKTHKYSVGRTYSCWMLYCWRIT